MAKNPNLTLSGVDLAALLCSRVCHDVIHRSARSTTVWSFWMKGARMPTPWT